MSDVSVIVQLPDANDTSRCHTVYQSNVLGGMTNAALRIVDGSVDQCTVTVLGRALNWVHKVSHCTDVVCSAYGIAAAGGVDGNIYTWIVDDRSLEDVYLQRAKTCWATPCTDAGLKTFAEFLLGRPIRNLSEGAAPLAIFAIDTDPVTITVEKPTDHAGEVFVCRDGNGNEAGRWGFELVVSADFADGTLAYIAAVEMPESYQTRCRLHKRVH